MKWLWVDGALKRREGRRDVDEGDLSRCQLVTMSRSVCISALSACL